MPGARDGQLRVRRGDDTPPWALQMFDDDLGLWLTLAQADVEEDAMRAGIPILRGPYAVDFTDIPHDGDTMNLWTPEVGDVLLRLFWDYSTVTQWDTGRLFFGPAVNTTSGFTNILARADAGDIGLATGQNGLLSMEAWGGNQADASGTTIYVDAWVFHSTAPMQVQLDTVGGADPTQGHLELYALVARAVAP